MERHAQCLVSVRLQGPGLRSSGKASTSNLPLGPGSRGRTHLDVPSPLHRHNPALPSVRACSPPTQMAVCPKQGPGETQAWGPAAPTTETHSATFLCSGLQSQSRRVTAITPKTFGCYFLARKSRKSNISSFSLSTLAIVCKTQKVSTVHLT